MFDLSEMDLAVRPSGRHAGRDRDIAHRYLAGQQIARIATEVGICERTVRNVARRFGLPQRNPRRTERNQLVIESYLSGERVEDIAAAHGIGRSNVRAIAARAALPPRSGWQRRYPLNEAAFEDPCPVGWWLIGLLAADGSINQGEHRVSLCQNLDDADVLRAFYAYVGCPERPPTLLRLSDSARQRQWDRRPAAEARIFSNRIVETLARHGVVARKSLHLRLGSEASRQPAVWLGILDGDGYAGIYRRRSAPLIAFFGAPPLMRQCERYWRKALGLTSRRPTARPHRAGVWTFRLSGSRAVAGARILLASSPKSLGRKRIVLGQIAALESAPTLSV